MVEDLAGGLINQPEDPSVQGAQKLIESRQPEVISYSEWLRIDAEETSRGEAAGRPRVKFTDIAEMVNIAKA